MSEMFVMGLTLVGLMALVGTNIAMYVFFRRCSGGDADYQRWAKTYSSTASVLPVVALLFNFRILKFLYSGLFSLDVFMVQYERPRKNLLIPLSFVTIFNFIGSYGPVLVANFVVFGTVQWGYQLLIVCIETTIISLAIVVF